MLAALRSHGEAASVRVWSTGFHATPRLRGSFEFRVIIGTASLHQLHRHSPSGRSLRSIPPTDARILEES